MECQLKISENTLNFQISDNKSYLEESKNWMVYFILKQRLVASDSWFFISGFLTTQLFFKSSRDFDISNLRHISHHFEHFFYLVFYKISRLLVPFYVTVQALRITMKHMNENSILSVPSNDHFTCDNSVINILFFNTYVQYSNRVSF